MERQKDVIGGLMKGLRVIETFTAERPRQSIAQVSEVTGLDRATARRCLLTLVEGGYADYDGKFFTLTPRVLRLGMACLASLPLAQIVQPWLERLSAEMGESCSVSILDDREIVYVARSSQKRVMSIALMPGSRLPAYCTSMGRVLLAALPEPEARARIEATERVARTPQTLTGVEEIMARIAEARRDGYAVIDQEIEIGLQTIGAPLLDARGRVVAAVNIGLPARSGAVEEIIRDYLPLLQRFQADLKGVLA